MFRQYLTVFLNSSIIVQSHDHEGHMVKFGRGWGDLMAVLSIQGWFLLMSCDRSGHVTEQPFDHLERLRDAAEMFSVLFFGSEKVNSIFIT